MGLQVHNVTGCLVVMVLVVGGNIHCMYRRLSVRNIMLSHNGTFKYKFREHT